MRSILSTFFLCFLILGFSSAATVAAPDPVEQIRPVVEKISHMILDPKYKALSQKEQFAQFLVAAKECFDFDEMSKRVLGPQWNSLSAEQKSVFVDRFTSLLGHTYIDKIDSYTGQPIVYGKARVKGTRAEVPTFLQNGSTTVPISYIMQLDEGEWMAYDLVVENISLVRNYMEQLRSILQRDGYDGLIKQIEEKIAVLEQHKA